MTTVMTQASPRASLVKTACVLWGAGMVGAIAVLPYVTDLEAGAIKAAALASGLRVSVLLGTQLAQTAILLATAVFAGLWAARKIGLGVPILDALISGQRVPQRNLTQLVPAIALGLAAGLVITILARNVCISTPRRHPRQCRSRASCVEGIARQFLWCHR